MGRHGSPSSAGACEVCGVPPKEHPRCNACGALVGKGISDRFPGHTEQSLQEYKGLKLCASCYKNREKARYYSDFWSAE